MKYSILAFLLVAFSAAAIVSAHGQSAPSAYKGSLSVEVGGIGSMFQPDYAGGTASSNHLYGLGAYGDVRISRWEQVEVEARWLHFNQTLGIYENTYSIGPRIPIVENFHRFTPYGKVLIGWGAMPALTGKALMFTYGGGIDYRLSRRFTLRCIDYEFQQWRVSPNDLWPNGASVGISYRIF